MTTANIAPDLLPLAQPIDTLHEMPGNPRRGDIDAVARSYERFGQRKPIVARRDGTVIAGNHQLKAARKLGWDRIAVIYTDDDDTTAKAYALADNRTSELGEIDPTALAEMISSVDDAAMLADAGYSETDLAALLNNVTSVTELPDAVNEPEPVAAGPAKTIRGDVWLLGPHRVMCGDSTNPTDVARLMGERHALLIHADPPYGMGKESDGVLNDNLYDDKLDAFQMSWWRACRPHVEDNGSAYIWGNAPDLWRLWYVGGLADSEHLELRNEIVWDKGSGFGMGWDGATQYQPSTERCLFFQFGNQFLAPVNTADFPDDWEPLRAYLAAEADAAGITARDVHRICGVQMYSHWFTRAQFALIGERYYETLVAQYPGYFLRPWHELKAEWDRGKLEGRRSYFDNSHEIMRDVWQFPRVHGDERYDHATPKPVDMIGRALKSSTPEGALTLEPFGGSGSTLIAAHITKRHCYTMELDPRYVDTICRRWQRLTGIIPIAEATGNEHNFLAE